MIADLKPYPVMKDSGVPWLGGMPEHWEVRRGKWLFRHRKQINTDRSNSNVLSLTLRGVVNNDPENPEGLLPKDYATYQFIRKGDLVFKLIDLENLKTSRVGLVHEDGIMSSAYVRLTPQKVVDIRFFFQQYFDLYQRGIYNQLGAGVRSTLGSTDLLDLSVVVPPLPEQAAIVSFLDYMDRRLRRYIRAKQKLIKLLEEQKQAIIHRAVTRGLDPNVRLKPSGVEWLGDVPEHWNVVALHLRYSQCLGKMLDAKRVLGVHSLPYLRNTDVQWDRINAAHLPVMDIAPSEYDRYTVRSGDLLVCEGGEVGRCAIWSGGLEPCGFQKALHRLRPLSLERDLPRFLYYIFRVATKSGAFEDGHESTIAHLTGDKLRAHRLPFPGKSDQVEIVSYLDTTSAAIDRTMAEAHSEIALLREYRTRLIADVVTGKLDVREAAANLPEETEEMEPLDEADALSNAEEETEVAEELEE